MATAKELYSREYESLAPLSVLAGCYFNHVEEANLEDAFINLEHFASDKVEIRVLKEFYFDYRPRIWRLATVWFEGNPIMIIQNAGREGDDHAERFITDSAGFAKMCEHLYQICCAPVIAEQSTIQKDVIDTETDDPRLTTFYSNSLDGYFKRY